MNHIPDPELIDDENPEWTEQEIKTAAKLTGLPKTLQDKLSRHRGPQKKPTKEPVSIRLNPEVIAYFKNQGKGWQGKINDVLRDYVDEKTNKAL